MVIQSATATDPQLLTIRLFGAFSAARNDAPLPRARSRTVQWMLAFLTLRHGQALDRDWLAGVFWPNSPEPGALANLRRGLNDLRRMLGGDAYRLNAPTSRTVCLDLAGASVDVVEFDAAIRAGDATSMERAIGLYRGPLLEGCVEEWSVPERREREEKCLDALELLAVEALARGEHSDAARLLHRAVSMDPLRESAHCALLKTLAASGDYAAVDRHYRDLRLALRREINAEPAEETAGLYRRLRSRGRAASPSPPRSDAAPLRRLPCPLTRLIGRQSDIETVVAFLDRERLVTLTGSGGVGKTRLAIAVAEHTATEYPDGVWFVELASLSDPALVPDAVGSVLGIREQPDRPMAETLQDFLRPRSLLLVMDNCEHLLPACAALTASLLGACARVRILATSREAMGLTGEIAWQVPWLAVPERLDKALTGDCVLDYDAVRLFADRASQALAGISLQNESLLAAAEVCRRLDGIPLAIELAAARSNMLSVQEIADRLHDRFRLLTGGSRAAFPHQQTLQATLDWSYDLLTAEEKKMLRGLSVFAGGWSLEAATAVCGRDGLQDWEVLDLLSQLRNKSLIVVQNQDGRSRYRLLESVRHYGRDRMFEIGEQAEVWRWHRAYFLALAEEAKSNADGREAGAWFDRLETEHDNLRAALDRCADDPAGSQDGLRVASLLVSFWEVRGHSSEGRTRITTALSHEGAQMPTKTRADALSGADVLAFYQGDYSTASLLGAESLAMRRDVGDIRGIADSLTGMGTIAYDLGDLDKARSLYDEALQISWDLGDRHLTALNLSNLGEVAERLADYETANRLFQDSRTLAVESGNRFVLLCALDGLGFVALKQGELGQAGRYGSDSLRLCRELGNRRMTAVALENMAEVALGQAQPGRAAQLLGAAAALRERIGAPPHPTDKEEADRITAALRQALDKETFDAASATGRALEWEQAIDYALLLSAAPL